jgi:hypothetical protein
MKSYTSLYIVYIGQRLLRVGKDRKLYMYNITFVKTKTMGVNEYYYICYIYNFCNNILLKINELSNFLCITFLLYMYNFV